MKLKRIKILRKFAIFEIKSQKIIPVTNITRKRFSEKTNSCVYK